MPAHTLRHRIDQGEVVLGSFAYLSDPSVVEIMAAAGMDFVIVDMEHTALDMGGVLAMVRGAHASGIAAVVRMPSMDPKLALRILETGADGVMLPMVRDAEEARALVAATRYPPHGTRGSCRVARATDWGSFNDGWREHVERQNADVMTWALVEDQVAGQEMEGIVEALDVTFVGRTDLASDLGVPGQLDHPLVGAYAERHEAAAKASGKAPGCLVHTAEIARDKIAQGYRVVVFSIDAKVLRDGFARWTDPVRASLAAPAPSSSPAAAG